VRFEDLPAKAGELRAVLERADPLFSEKIPDSFPVGHLVQEPGDEIRDLHYQSGMRQGISGTDSKG
jgi:hypothetical protein